MAENPIEILLVEDNPNDVELTLRVFHKHNLTQRIRMMRDGAEALEFLFNTSTTFSLKVILLDLKLPKVDGLEMLRCLKADWHTRTIPVVVLTSSREERDIVESYQLGVNKQLHCQASGL